jgi:hypothetical protein
VTRSDWQYPPEEEAAPAATGETATGEAEVNGAEELAAPAQEEFDPSDEDKTRFTMILAPAQYILIKDSAAYSVFKKKNKGDYPAVDFKKDMIIMLESDGILSNGFFEIAETEINEDSITVNYKLNLIGGSERGERAAYAVAPKSGKQIILKQVK